MRLTKLEGKPNLMKQTKQVI